MAQHQSYITLDSVVNDFLIESEQPVSKYFKNFHLAFRCMDNLGINFFYQVRSVKLPINSNLTVNLPPDYLNWTKVGVLNDIGEIIPLYYNDKLTTYADLSPDRIEKTTDDTLLDSSYWGVNTWANYWTGSGVISIYGVPSGAPFVGNFKVDVNNGVILLNQSYNREYLMLEYVASPKEGEEYYIPIQFREAMIAWLWWKNSSAIPARSHINLGDREGRKRDYYNEKRNAVAAYKPIRKSEIYQASQEQTRSAIKT